MMMFTLFLMGFIIVLLCSLLISEDTKKDRLLIVLMGAMFVFGCIVSAVLHW